MEGKDNICRFIINKAVSSWANRNHSYILSLLISMYICMHVLAMVYENTDNPCVLFVNQHYMCY